MKKEYFAKGETATVKSVDESIATYKFENSGLDTAFIQMKDLSPADRRKLKASMTYLKAKALDILNSVFVSPFPDALRKIIYKVYKKITRDGKTEEEYFIDAISSASILIFRDTIGDALRNPDRYFAFKVPLTEESRQALRDIDNMLATFTTDPTKYENAKYATAAMEIFEEYCTQHDAWIAAMLNLEVYDTISLPPYSQEEEMNSTDPPPEELEQKKRRYMNYVNSGFLCDDGDLELSYETYLPCNVSPELFSNACLGILSIGRMNEDNLSSTIKLWDPHVYEAYKDILLKYFNKEKAQDETSQLFGHVKGRNTAHATSPRTNKLSRENLKKIDKKGKGIELTEVSGISFESEEDGECSSSSDTFVSFSTSKRRKKRKNSVSLSPPASPPSKPSDRGSIKKKKNDKRKEKRKPKTDHLYYDQSSSTSE